jgi:hypothetical protein
MDLVDWMDLVYEGAEHSGGESLRDRLSAAMQEHAL